MAKRPRTGQHERRQARAAQEFEPPQTPDQEEETGEEALQGYSAPSDEDLSSEAVDAETRAIEAEMDPDLLALKREIDEQLAALAGDLMEGASVQEVGGSNIVGVGLGSGDASAAAGDFGANILPGESALVIFTVEPVSNDELMAELASVAGTRALSTLPIIQVPVGIVDAYSHRMRMRPAPGGISAGHFRITAGTLGCLCTGTTAPRNSRLMILSNNHVLANSNGATIGDCISQPGAFDGGACPRDQVAVLERFIPINFGGGINYVDCATGWAWPDRVRRELMYMSGTNPVFFRIGSTPVAPVPGLIVGKTGRTTQLKQGRVSAVNVTVNVNFGGGRVGHFRDQIAITGVSGGFSAGGDSGSLIWQWSPTRAPVGLLFAGGGGTTFGNRITRVLQSLAVRLVT